MSRNVKESLLSLELQTELKTSPTATMGTCGVRSQQPALLGAKETKRIEENRKLRTCGNSSLLMTIGRRMSQGATLSMPISGPRSWSCPSKALECNEESSLEAYHSLVARNTNELIRLEMPRV